MAATSYEGIVSRVLNRRFSRPIARWLARTPATPNQVTFLSFLIGLGAGLAFGLGNNILGGILAQVSSVVDGVDGDLARLKGMSSQFGAFFDAVLDRYADAAILAGMTLWAYRFEGREAALWVGLLAILGALMISYSRARAEASVEVRLPDPLIFLASRDLRLLAVMVGGVVGQAFWTLAFLAVITNLVVMLRILFVRKTQSIRP